MPICRKSQKPEARKVTLLKALDCPENIHLGAEFEARIRIQNLTPKRLHLWFRLQTIDEGPNFELAPSFHPQLRFSMAKDPADTPNGIEHQDRLHREIRHPLL